MKDLIQANSSAIPDITTGAASIADAVAVPARGVTRSQRRPVVRLESLVVPSAERLALRAARLVEQHESQGELQLPPPGWPVVLRKLPNTSSGNDSCDHTNDALTVTIEFRIAALMASLVVAAEVARAIAVARTMTVAQTIVDAQTKSFRHAAAVSVIRLTQNQILWVATAAVIANAVPVNRLLHNRILLNISTVDTRDLRQSLQLVRRIHGTPIAMALPETRTTSIRRVPPMRSMTPAL